MSFLLEVGQVFAELGREVEVDTASSTLAVESALPEQSRLLVVVRPLTQALTIYAVHPREVPAERLAALAELAARANATEFTVTIELDHAQGTVSTRAGLELLGVELTQLDAESMLGVLVAEVESVARCYTGPIDAVVAGEVSPATAAAQGLAARRDERFAEATPTPTK